MAVPANEEVADDRKTSTGKGGPTGYAFPASNLGKGGHAAGYAFQLKDEKMPYIFHYEFFVDYSNGKRKGLRFDNEKLVRLLILLLQGLIYNYDMLRNP